MCRISEKNVLLATWCHVCEISKLGVNITGPVSRGGGGVKLFHICGWRAVLTFLKSSGEYTYHHVQNLKTKLLIIAPPPQCVFTFLLCFLEQTAIISLYGINRLVFMRFRKILKSDCQLGYVRPSVRLPACNKLSPTGWIFIWNEIFAWLLKNLSMKLKSD